MVIVGVLVVGAPVLVVSSFDEDDIEGSVVEGVVGDGGGSGCVNTTTEITISQYQYLHISITEASYLHR